MVDGGPAIDVPVIEIEPDFSLAGTPPCSEIVDDFLLCDTGAFFRFVEVTDEVVGTDPSSENGLLFTLSAEAVVGVCPASSDGIFED
jgi:hypothetical protein